MFAAGLICRVNCAVGAVQTTIAGHANKTCGVAFYSDKHSIFRVNSKDAAGGDRIT
jgi:hypothetical protein